MSSNLENKIKNLIKQNDSIYNSLLSKNILFERTNINEQLSDEDKIILLSEENEKLKNISKSNRPPEVKIVKQEIVKQVILKPTVLEKINDDEEENYETPVKKFSTITNMEDITPFLI